MPLLLLLVTEQPVQGSNKFVRWIITDGVLGSPQVVTVNGVGNWGAPHQTLKL
ncbi:hypothetical protein NXX10_25315 [Bacteroides xylanisolvens]|nr:hypothetical protein [Bacteroides xylanisolvens]